MTCNTASRCRVNFSSLLRASISIDSKFRLILNHCQPNMSDDSGSCTFVGFLLVYIRGFSFYGPKQDRPRKYVNAFGRRDVVACFGSGSRRAETVQGAQSQGKEGGLPRLNSAVRKVGLPPLVWQYGQLPI